MSTAERYLDIRTYGYNDKTIHSIHSRLIYLLFTLFYGIYVTVYFRSTFLLLLILPASSLDPVSRKLSFNLRELYLVVIFISTDIFNNNSKLDERA